MMPRQRSRSQADRGRLDLRQEVLAAHHAREVLKEGDAFQPSAQTLSEVQPVTAGEQTKTRGFAVVGG